MAANIFEAKAEICYCVPNGASLCACCRERRAAKKSENPWLHAGTLLKAAEGRAIRKEYKFIGVDWARDTFVENSDD